MADPAEDLNLIEQEEEDPDDPPPDDINVGYDDPDALHSSIASRRLGGQ
jgi:hypothetical protein